MPSNATAKPAKSSAPTLPADVAPPDFADPDSAEGLELLCAANHPAEPVDWLWHDHIAVGKVTLIAGDPGLGKSLVAIDVAARVTRGLPFPSDLPPSTLPLPPSPSPGSVLILSAADDLADTIRPRLDAAGADPNRVFTLPSITDLRHDFGQLKAAVDRVPNCRLIIVDPVNAFVGPSDSHFHTVVRRVLTPLTRLATERGIAILAVTQFRKNDGAAIHRAAGSTGFVATARSLWTVCRDPRDVTRNLLLPLKQNLTSAARGLAFRIAAETGALAPHVAWEPQVAALSTEEAFARPQKPRPLSPERSAARDWLRACLADGPRPARNVLDEGEERGFLNRTLRRAFHELGGQSAKRGLLQGWWWSLANADANGSSQANGANGTEAPQKTAVLFEGVTFDEDVAQQEVIDQMLRENERASALFRLETGHELAELRLGIYRPPEAATPAPPPPVSTTSAPAPPPIGRLSSAPPPPPKTGNPLLDNLLVAFDKSWRASGAADEDPPPIDSRSKLSPDSGLIVDQVQWSPDRPFASSSPRTLEPSR